jgi:hypothetical protein
VPMRWMANRTLSESRRTLPMFGPAPFSQSHILERHETINRVPFAEAQTLRHCGCAGGQFENLPSSYSVVLNAAAAMIRSSEVYRRWSTSRLSAAASFSVRSPSCWVQRSSADPADSTFQIVPIQIDHKRWVKTEERGRSSLKRRPRGPSSNDG